jgi:hypothetical protein
MCELISAIVFAFLASRRKRSRQYEVAQKQTRSTRTILLNQAGLFAEVLHDKERAIAVAREFISRFPQSPRAEAVRQVIDQLQTTKADSK